MQLEILYILGLSMFISGLIGYTALIIYELWTYEEIDLLDRIDTAYTKLAKSIF